MPVVGLDRGTEESVVTGEGEAHRLRVLFPEAGAALDVRKQEGDRGGRKIRHRADSRRRERKTAGGSVERGRRPVTVRNLPRADGSYLSFLLHKRDESLYDLPGTEG